MPDTVPSGQVLEKTTRTRVLPAIETQTIEFWPYIEALTMPDSEHLLYLYLQRDNRNIPYGQYTSHIPLRDGKIFAINDKEACESGIQKRFGGGVWRLILKRNRQRKCETRVYTGDGPTMPPPTDAEPEQIPSNMGPLAVQPADSSVQIAGKAIDAVANQDVAGLKVAADILAATGQMQINAMTMMKNLAAAPAAPPSESDQLVRMMMLKMMEKMIDKLDAPPPAQTQNGLVDRIMSAAIDRILTPPIAAEGGTVSTGAALVGILPQVITGVTEVSREARLMREAERDAVIASRTGMPQPGVATASAPQPPQILPPSQPAPARNPASPANGGTVSGAPTLDFIETRIVQLLRANVTAEEAADRTLEFLYTLEGENPQPEQQLVAQLVGLGETGLLQLFQRRPILRQIGGDEKQTPRLLEFIRAFLKLYTEEKAQEEKEANERKPN